MDWLTYKLHHSSSLTQHPRTLGRVEIRDDKIEQLVRSLIHGGGLNPADADVEAQKLLGDRFGDEGYAAWARYTNARALPRRQLWARRKNNPAAGTRAQSGPGVDRRMRRQRAAEWAQATADPDVRRQINEREREVGIRTIWPPDEDR